MAADGHLRHAEPVRHMTRRQTLTEEVDNLPFAHRQFDTARVGQGDMTTARAIFELLREAADELARERGLAAQHSAEDVRQPRMVDALENEPAGADPQRVEELLVGNLVGEDDDGGFGHAFADARGRAEAASGQTKIDQADLGPITNRFFDRLVGITDLSANDETGSLEREADPAADTDSAFGDEYPWFARTRLGDDACQAQRDGFERLRDGGRGAVQGLVPRGCRPVDGVDAACNVIRRCNANRR
jgi:hypothetical protein